MDVERKLAVKGHQSDGQLCVLVSYVGAAADNHFAAVLVITGNSYTRHFAKIAMWVNLLSLPVCQVSRNAY